MMDRCALAMEYHNKGFNCAQSVLAACKDLTGLSERDSLAIAGGFGRGMGTGAEVCGALSGANMALSMIFPHLQENDEEGKKNSYRISKKLQNRFAEQFGHIHCSALLKSGVSDIERFPTAKRLGLNTDCAVFIVTAVELVEKLSEELKFSK